jgi:hypothetical protein
MTTNLAVAATQKRRPVPDGNGRPSMNAEIPRRPPGLAHSVRLARLPQDYTDRWNRASRPQYRMGRRPARDQRRPRPRCTPVQVGCRADEPEEREANNARRNRVCGHGQDHALRGSGRPRSEDFLYCRQGRLAMLRRGRAGRAIRSGRSRRAPSTAGGRAPVAGS